MLYSGHTIRILPAKTGYWKSLEQLTGYYLESVRGLTTLKLFDRDEDRTLGLEERSRDFNARIMDVMKVNFASFLVTDGLIYGSTTAAVCLTAWQLAQGQVTFGQSLMFLMLSFGFFGSVRQLMTATHAALAGVSAADKMEQLLAIDTSRPYNPQIPLEIPSYEGIRLEGIRFSYPHRGTTLENLSLDIPKGQVTALVGLSGSGKSTIAGILMRFYDLDQGRCLLEGRDYISMTPEELRRRVAMVPQTYVELTDEQDVKNLQRTLDLLDEDDDVTDVWTNWDE